MYTWLARTSAVLEALEVVEDGRLLGRLLGRSRSGFVYDESQFCKSRVLVVSHFVQEALLDRLEELEDIDDLKRIRHEPTRPLADVIRELRLVGTL